MNFNDQYNVVCENIWMPHLFEMIVQCVQSDGGDGCGTVVSDNFKELADEFDAWRQENVGAKSYFRNDTSDSVLFSDNSNESIQFTRKRDSSNGDQLFGVYVFKVNKQTK